MASLRRERDQLQSEVNRLSEQLTAVTVERSPEPPPDFEAIRDRYLAIRKLGKQSPEYKETIRVFKRLIKYLKSG